MSQPADVEIFCDGNKNIGVGHIRRSTALCNHLINTGITACLTGISAVASTLIPEQKYAGGESKVVVFDIFEGIETRIEQAKKDNKICVTLDWFGKAVPDINIVIYPHEQVFAQQKSYVGFEYIMLREEITSLRQKVSSTEGSKVFICLGGGDLKNQGYSTALKLSDLGLDVTLVCGPLSARMDNRNSNFKILVNPSNFPFLLSECDWAITNGGGCFFEAACLGKAAYILPQTDMEMAIAKYAEEKSAILGIGVEGLRNFELQKIRTVATKAFSIIDGAGLERVSAIIKNAL